MRQVRSLPASVHTMNEGEASIKGRIKMRKVNCSRLPGDFALSVVSTGVPETCPRPWIGVNVIDGKHLNDIIADCAGPRRSGCLFPALDLLQEPGRIDFKRGLRGSW